MSEGLSYEESSSSSQAVVALLTSNLDSEASEDAVTSGGAEATAATRETDASPTAIQSGTTGRISICAHSETSLPDPNPSVFVRNAQWCADGQAVLTVCEDSTIHIFDVCDDLRFEPSLSVTHPAPVLSTTWFPTASPADPSSYCFVEAVRDCPVKLIDASDGRLRASYRIVDHQERFVAPHSMAFNMYMNKLYCGFEDAIEVFDVHQPGVEGTRLHTVPTKKSRDGLRGIVSALAFAPDWSGTYAAGSYAGGIALYTEDTGAEAQSWLHGVEGGVTQVMFNPTQTHLVHAAFRLSSTIATWDTRNPSQPVDYLHRGGVRTNQRLWFDVSFDGRWIVAGDGAGMMTVWDAENPCDTRTSVSAHKDAVGVTAFHPNKPIIMSASGSRHFEELVSDDESTGEEDQGVISTVRRPIARDRSIRLWSYESV